MLFTDEFELSIDAKQRLAIPSRVRSLLERAGAPAVLYLTPGPNGALWLWPEPTFEKAAGEVEPTLTPSTEQMDFDEVTFPEAQRLEIDGAGRVRLPQKAITRAGLGSRVMLAGMRHHLEIWDIQRWEDCRKDKAARRGEIAQRARSAHADPAPEARPTKSRERRSHE